MPDKIIPSGNSDLFEDKIIFHLFSFKKIEDRYYLYNRYDYFFLDASASDSDVGKAAKKAMQDYTIFEGDENKPTPEKGMGRIDRVAGAKTYGEYAKKALNVQYYLNEEKGEIKFTSLKRRANGWGQIEPDPSFSISGDALDEEIGAALRKAFALCDPKKNEYLQALYPNGDFPPEVVKMHGVKALAVAAPKVDPIVAGPHPFGMRTTWLAVKNAEDPLVFMDALGVFKFRPIEWEEGIRRVLKVFRGDTVLVTPQIQGWSFVVWPCFGEKGIQRAQMFLARLSGEFGEAQAFGSERGVGYVLWAKARKGQIVRWYRRVQGETESLGAVTKEEKKLLKYTKLPVDDWMPDEDEDPFKIAEAWSLNPMDFAPGVPQAAGPCWTGTAMKG